MITDKKRPKLNNATSPSYCRLHTSDEPPLERNIKKDKKKNKQMKRQKGKKYQNCHDHHCLPNIHWYSSLSAFLARIYDNICRVAINTFSDNTNSHHITFIIFNTDISMINDILSHEHFGTRHINIDMGVSSTPISTVKFS